MKFLLKNTFFAIFLSFFSIFSNITYSSDFRYVKDIQVGNEPVGVFYDSKNDIFHIFCKGTDKDFDGNYEPDQGDTLPSWWVLKIDRIGEVKNLTKVKEFPFASIPFPFRPAFVPSERKIWINHSDGIVAYNLDTYEQIDEKINISGVTSLDYKSGHLLISQSSFSGNLDTAFVYSINQKKIMNKYPIGINLVQASMYQPKNPDYKGIVAISVGNFGSDSSVFHKAIFPHFQLPKFKDTLIGNTANFLEVIDDQFVAIPVMVSNKVVLTDLYNENYFTEIALGEPGWDGPSYVKFLPISQSQNPRQYLLLITNYDGLFEIYKFSYQTFENGVEYLIEHLETIDLVQKGEALAFSEIDKDGNSIVVVANSLKSDYSPNNKVSIVLLGKLFTSISQNFSSNNLFKLKDNSIEFLGEIKENTEFAIYDIFGNKVISTTEQKIISLVNLSSGVYFAKVFGDEMIHNFKFTFLK